MIKLVKKCYIIKEAVDVPVEFKISWRKGQSIARFCNRMNGGKVEYNDLRPLHSTSSLPFKKFTFIAKKINLKIGNLY